MKVDARLAFPLGGAWLAAGLAIGAPELSVAVLIALWLLAAGLAIAGLAAKAGWPVVLAVTCAAAALATSSAALAAGQRRPELLIDLAHGGRFVTVLIETSQSSVAGTSPLSGRIIAVDQAGPAPALSAPVLVFDGAPATPAGLGTTIEVAGSLVTTDPRDNVAFLLFASGPAEALAPPADLLGWANGLRDGLAAAANRLPGPGGDLLPGLAIGDTSQVGATLDAEMKTASLSHLTAVSGANCAIIVGIVMVGGATLGLGRVTRIVLSILVLLAFVVLVTPEPSVLRAALMAAIVLLSLAGGRPVRGVPVLCLAAIALLVADPWLSRDYGFTLSVLATAGLLLLAGPLARAASRWMPMPVAVVISVPLAAQLACQPVLVLLEPSLPTFGVIANLLAAPAAPLATTIGLLACVVLPSVPWLGGMLAGLAWLPASWIAGVAAFFAGLPGARLDWPGGLTGVLLLAVGTALALVALLGRRKRWPAAGLVVLFVGWSGVTAGERIVEAVTRPGDWQVAACDVGQGDAVVVRSLDQTALIDTGPDPRTLDACLDELGVVSLDLLVLTHFDLDHIGGVDAVLGRAERTLIGPTAEPADERLVEKLIASGTTVEQVSRGPSGVLGELRWQVLWPPARLGSIEPGNEASIALTFLPVGECGGGCLSSIFLGDLDERSQTIMAGATAVPAVDVVKVSHHGSADQSASLYSRIGATVGLIGVGAGNDYGHPTDRLLEILDSAGTQPARTDRLGMILLSPGERPGSVEVWTQKSH